MVRSSVNWTMTGDLTELNRFAGAQWETEPAVHTMLLSVVHKLSGTANTERPVLVGGWLPARDGAVVGTFCFAAGNVLLLGTMPVGAARQLAEDLATTHPDVSSVQGPRSAVAEFADTWEQLTGASRTRQMAQKLHRLGDLVEPPRRPAGIGRLARTTDRDLLIDWFGRFAEESGTGVGDLGAIVDYRIESGGLYLWEVDGSPVAMAGASVPVCGCVRITPVYTPPALRRRGFAGAAVAGAVRAAVASGVETIVLFTDLANPTSNALYRALGFVSIADSMQIIYR